MALYSIQSILLDYIGERYFLCESGISGQNFRWNFRCAGRSAAHLPAGAPLASVRYSVGALQMGSSSIGKGLAGRQGFEPRYADPESAVLPLDDLPAGKANRHSTAAVQTNRAERGRALLDSTTCGR